MLVFFKERLVFLSMPKTGSSAYEAALRDHADIVISNPPDLKHAPLYRYDRFFRPIFENVCGVEMETIAVMREPIDWLGSWFRYRRRPFMDGKPNATHHVDFNGFVNAYMKGKPPAFAAVGRQSRFLTPKPGRPPITRVFRFDALAGLDAFLEDRLGVSLETPRLNVSPDLPLALAPGVERRLRDKFAEDFSLFDNLPK